MTKRETFIFWGTFVAYMAVTAAYRWAVGEAQFDVKFHVTAAVAFLFLWSILWGGQWWAIRRRRRERAAFERYYYDEDDDATEQSH